MPRASPLFASFNTGEVSRRLWARTDFKKYASALEIGENVLSLAEGALMRRSGTRFVCEVKSSAVKHRGARFQFSTSQAYAIIKGEQNFQFCRNQARITVGDTDAVIANGAFTAGITSWTDRSTGSGSIAHDAGNGRLSLVPGGTGGTDIGWAEQSVAVGVSFQATEHVLKFRVLGAPSDRVQLRIGTASVGSQLIADKLCEVGWHCVAFTPGASPVFIQFRNLGSFRNKTVQIDDVSLLDNQALEITTPYAESELFDVNGPQSADVQYIFSPTHPTYKLERFGHTTWSLVEVAWIDGPYLPENATTTTLTFTSATALGTTVTASAITGINDGVGFKTTDVGRLIRLTDGTVNWGYAVIVGWTSTTVVTADVRRTVVVTTAETKWRLGSWSGTTGYPRCGAFYEQRLASGNTTEQPQTFWLSQTGDFENQSPDSPNAADGTTFAGTVEDDDALDYTISADDVQSILWMSPGEDTLVIGTASGEWTPSSQGAVLTPSDITVRQQTTHGSANVQPVRVDHVALFVQKAKRKLREFSFDFNVQGYRALDMTRLAEHITFGGILEMDYAEEPNSVVWAVRADGQLLSMTFRREEDVVGWTRNILGGSFSGGDAVVESVWVIPGADGSGQVQSSEARDEVWMIVKRTINGSTKRYVEVLERDYEDGHAQEDAYYADAIITYDGAPATSITGLSHLEGETVKVYADGYVHPDCAVSSGGITLESAASVVQIGLGYTHRAKTLKLEAGTAAGTAIGKTGQIFGITFCLVNSLTLTFGPDEDHLTMVDFREVGDAMDTAVPLFTGEYFSEFDDDWKSDSRIFIVSDDPCPFMLAAMAPEVDKKDFRA